MHPLQLILMLVAIGVSALAATFAYRNLRGSARRDKREKLGRQYRLAEVNAQLRALEAWRDAELVDARDDLERSLKIQKEGGPDKIHVASARFSGEMTFPDFHNFKVEQIREKCEQQAHPLRAEKTFIEQQLENS